MSNLSGFDATQVEPNPGYSPLPEGKYVVLITGSEMRTTKAGNGRYLELVQEVLEGEYKGRRIYSRLNLEHPNVRAVEFARAQLSAICRALGVLRPKDSIELHNLPMVVDVRLRKNRETGDFGNEVKGWHKREPSAGTPNGPTVPGATSDRPPWAR